MVDTQQPRASVLFNNLFDRLFKIVLVFLVGKTRDLVKEFYLKKYKNIKYSSNSFIFIKNLSHFGYKRISTLHESIRQKPVSNDSVAFMFPYYFCVLASHFSLDSP